MKYENKDNKEHDSTAKDNRGYSTKQTNIQQKSKERPGKTKHGGGRQHRSLILHQDTTG